MEDLLCHFARRFPMFAANLLDRDKHKRRNFREETVTDLIMAGLTAFEPCGVRVDFPADESKTGEDMDWEFVDPQNKVGKCYLRLHIQAKRAIKSSGKKPYWFYRELDHAVPSGALHGSQHELLLSNAKTTKGCVPLYMFYHPLDALEPKSGKLPAVEGVNLVFADQIKGKLSKSRWPVADKKVEKLRPNFLALPHFLCFGHGLFVPFSAHEQLSFLSLQDYGFVYPEELADRLNELRSAQGAEVQSEIQAIKEIPESTLRAISLDRSGGEPIEVERPRVIFYR